MNPKVDWFFNKDTHWQKEVRKLRRIVLDCGLTEELKWGNPCYTLDGTNIVLIHIFKEYCALLFFKGALLEDPKGLLVQQTENVQAARQLRFVSLQEITKKESVIKSYIKQAIRVEKAGIKFEFKKTAEFRMPEEFQKKLDSSRALEEAFYALTPGRQRGYLLYFSSAKQARTREARVVKYMPQILKGKGLED
jgi:uncharacterized protein YdeI (YjbR/CyaY-like superfamily)